MEGLGTVARAVSKCFNLKLCFCNWNANWPIECEAMMAGHGGQFLHVSFSLPHDFLHFPEELSWKIRYFHLQIIFLTKINDQTIKKHDKTITKYYSGN